MGRKYSFLLMLVMLGTSVAQAQVNTNCTPPPELIAHYDNEIRSLAIRHAWQANLPDTALITASPALYQQIAEGMAAVYNSGSAARDSVFTKYCVHDPILRWDYRNFMIQFNPSQSWTSSWLSAQTVTGNPLVDSFFSRHQLQVLEYHNWFGEHYIIAEAARSLNYHALNDSLLLFPGILYSEPNSLIGGMSGEINYSKTGNLHTYDFTYRWNTSPVGGGDTYTWKFQVDDNCNTTYLGSAILQNPDYPVPLPAPLNCNLSVSAPQQAATAPIKVFPNPATNSVHLQSAFPLSDIRLFNTTGSCVLSQPAGADINVAHLPAGLYIISATDSYGKHYFLRLVKE